VSFEVLVLAVISGLRPATSQAAVVALLKSPDPRRTLLFFTVAGFAASMAIGLLLVLAFHGARVGLGGSTFTAVFNLVAGVVALAFAVGYRRGLVTVPRRERRAAPSAGAAQRLAQRLRNPSVAAAALAGVATHVPGLVYLVALNGVAAGEPGPATAVVQVAIYNALWFAIPLAALALATLRPGRAPDYVDRGADWARAHEQGLVFATFALLGAYLAIKGAVQLF
jgi:Sap, sulfolipid-1-addressing protein